MSERDFSQEDENLEAGEIQESTETPEVRELDQATQEPEAHVEATRGFEEAEQIEASVTDLVEEEAHIAIEDDPTTSPQGSEEISATPITLPGQSVEDEGAAPIPLPEPVELEPAIDPEDLVEPVPPSELPVEDTAEELVGAKLKGEDEIREPIPPAEMPPEVELADDVEMVKQEEDVDFKFFKPVPAEELDQSDMPPAEMPPEAEITDDVEMVKQQEEVDYKFYTPAPEEELAHSETTDDRISSDDESKIPALDGSSIIEPTLEEGLVKDVPEASEEEDEDEEIQS
ncbi:MAG: hypothetical protein P8Y68_17310 [Anaerolineales bacterium]|jgi:hypothetical protein